MISFTDENTASQNKPTTTNGYTFWCLSHTIQSKTLLFSGVHKPDFYTTHKWHQLQSKAEVTERGSCGRHTI